MSRIVYPDMLLVYIDESGISYEINSIHKDYFEDGPYALWVGLLVDDRKYFHLERGYYEIAKKVLNIKGWGEDEPLHSTQLWANKKLRPKVKNYYEELIQFITKINLNIVVGIQQKNLLFKEKVEEQKKELDKAMFSFVHLVEHQLGFMNETGVLLADSTGESHKNKNGELEESQKRLRNLVSERTTWRYSPETKSKLAISPKYDFEYRSNFIVDRLQYVNSKDTPMIQLVDNLCFIFKRVFEYKYLLKYGYGSKDMPKPNLDLLPITESTFNFFLVRCSVGLAFYDNSISDVNMSNLKDVGFVDFSNVNRGVLRNSGFERLIDSFTQYN